MQGSQVIPPLISKGEAVTHLWMAQEGVIRRGKRIQWNQESEDKYSESEDERNTARDAVVLGPVRQQFVMKTPQAGGKPSGKQ